MPIWLTINARSGVPIYVQLVDQVKHAIEVGTLQPGEQMPTVRQLVAELSIAPNTIVKAMNELQRMGLIESRAGAGSVVLSSTNGSLRKGQLEALEARLSELVRDAAGLQMERQQLEALFAEEVARYFSRQESEDAR